MIKPGLFIVRHESVQCTVCFSKVEKLNDTDDQEWGDIIQTFMDGHRETCDVHKDNGGK